jgi:hypothetical protein
MSPSVLHGGLLHRFPAGDAKGLAPLDRNGFGNGTPVIQPFPSKGTSPLARVFCPCIYPPCRSSVLSVFSCSMHCGFSTRTRARCGGVER